MPPVKCTATSRDGTPCNAYAGAGSAFCYHHDPERAVERRQARHRGGRARHGRRLRTTGQDNPITVKSVADVAVLLEHTLNETFQLENSIKRARTIGYLAGLLLKAMDVLSLEERIVRLEVVLNAREPRQ